MMLLSNFGLGYGSTWDTFNDVNHWMTGNSSMSTFFCPLTSIKSNIVYIRRVGKEKVDSIYGIKRRVEDAAEGANKH